MASAVPGSHQKESHQSDDDSVSDKRLRRERNEKFTHGSDRQHWRQEELFNGLEQEIFNSAIQTTSKTVRKCLRDAVKLANESVTHQTMGEISEAVTRELDTFCKVADRSRNLKGTFRKYLWEANTRIFAACAILNKRAHGDPQPSLKEDPSFGGVSQENV